MLFTLYIWISPDGHPWGVGSTPAEALSDAVRVFQRVQANLDDLRPPVDPLCLVQGGTWAQLTSPDLDLARQALQVDDAFRRDGEA